MLLYESDLYKQAQVALETSFGLRQIFDLLPNDIEFSISLDERIPCTLKMVDKKIILAAEKSSHADIHIVLTFESVRRLHAQSFDSATSLARELTEQFVIGHMKVKFLADLALIRNKGYFHILKKITPDLQGLIFQKLGQLFSNK